MTKYETLRNRINAADGAFCALTQIQNLCWALEFILTVKKVEDAHDAARTALSQKGINRGDSADLTIAYMAGYNNASIRHEDEIERLREMLDEKWQQMPEANRLRFYISKIEKLSDKKEAHDVPIDVLLFRIYKYTRIALEGKE